MRKFFVTTIIVFSALLHAQQGFVGVGTTLPNATLEVAANINDTASPDAILVSRMTRAQLGSKNAVYTSSQNGALVFITTLDGTNTGKTANVTATGFYYYDGVTTNTWLPVSADPPPRQTWEKFRGNVNTLASTVTSYTVQPTDYVVMFTASTVNLSITIPSLTDTAADIGRTIRIYNFSPSSGQIHFTSTANLRGDIPSVITRLRSIKFIWTGSVWVAPQR